MQWSDERLLVLLRCNRAHVWYLKNNHASRKILLHWHQTIVPQFNAMCPGLKSPLTMQTGTGKWECVLKKFQVTGTLMYAAISSRLDIAHAVHYSDTQPRLERASIGMHL